jgi:hypothetical protein
MGIFSALSGGLLGFAFDQENKSTAKKVVRAQQEAADKNRALYEQIYNQTRGDLSPYNQAGQDALGVLRSRLGLPASAAGAPGEPRTSVIGAQGFGGQFGSTAVGGPGVVGSGGPAYPGEPRTLPGTGGGADWATYDQQNPDVHAEYQRLQASPEGQAYLADKGITTPEQFDQLHYQTFGQTEGRALPMNASTSPTEVVPDYMNSRRPDAEAAPQYTRPADLSAPTIGGDPQVGDYFRGDWFHESPGFQFALNKALDSVNAKSAARGLLRSGDAAKALQSEATGLANQDFANAFARQLQLYGASRGAYDTDKSRELNLFTYNQNRGDQNFSEDRGYGTNLWDTQQNRRDRNFSDDRAQQTNQYNQYVSNLFGLTSAGQNAAAQTGTAGNLFANAVSQGNNNVADARSNATLWRSNNSFLNQGLRFAGAAAGGGIF